MRDPLVDLPPGPQVDLDPAVLDARSAMLRAAADLLAVPDDTLDRPWRWRPTDPEDVELRYGVYRILERLDEAAAAIARGRADGTGGRIGPAVPALAMATEARWDLQGVLLPLSEADWDADPGGGEWNVRRTVGHIIGGQRSYGWTNAWFLSHRATDVAVYPPDGVLPPDPDETEEALGEPESVRARIDDILDQGIVAFAGLDATALRVPARWSGVPVTIDFRLGRFGSHIREHTVQVDKTLEAIGRRPSEMDRLTRLVLGRFGRLEALLVGRGPDALATRFADGTDARGLVAAAVADVTETAARVRAAAG